ncbi:hypothetical protein QWZ13_04350 [Reinekea marina]|uniref:Polysaccharide chain length determinant protein (PEP-CTERM system associated) n=1 Tax=Reinekea marina TaxID=1310421 RepID=A0ABV7WQM3_9GAMM|nr:hypothetical protein [Reinekea marina]MDN3648135.1 hypothetical protein [Reinekea marina]
MDPTNIKEVLHAFKVELLKYRYFVVAAFIFISSVSLALGFLAPKSYTSKVILYADVTNIIGNLLDGKAEITKIDRSKEARDIIFTDRILRTVATNAGLENPDRQIAHLRNTMRITANNDYVTVQYSSSSPDVAFNVIDATTQAFVAETARKKREESSSAYEFINAQVETYKSQLEAAEQKLKEFSSKNIEITEAGVANQVSKYKNDIQILEFEIQDLTARLESYESELAVEPEFLAIERERPQSFEERQLENYEQRLSELRLSYLDTHPDIVSIQDQIAALRAQIANQKKENAANKEYANVENPAFTTLKELISKTRADLTAAKQRLNSNQRLLQGSLANAETVAAKQATFKELTRDYAVTKDVYEDMLKRRESARLTMTLDIEGQGVTYKIHEPASYPLHSDGLQTIHFAALGPILGFLAPLGVIGVMIFLDSKVRSATFMADNLPSHIQLMTTIPMYNNTLTELASLKSLLILGAIIVAFMGIYVGAFVAVPSLGLLNG